MPVGAGRALDHRDPEAEGLAGARGRGGEDVHAGERVREDQRLDRERGRDAEAVENRDDWCAHSERSKRLRHAFLPVEKRARRKSLETPDLRRNEKLNLPAVERRP